MKSEVSPKHHKRMGALLTSKLPSIILGTKVYGEVPYRFTCFSCPDKKECFLAGDAYNSDGDCILDKSEDPGAGIADDLTNPISHPCPTCRADPGEACFELDVNTGDDHYIKGFHVDRLDRTVDPY